MWSKHVGQFGRPEPIAVDASFTGTRRVIRISQQGVSFLMDAGGARKLISLIEVGLELIEAEIAAIDEVKKPS